MMAWLKRMWAAFTYDDARELRNAREVYKRALAPRKSPEKGSSEDT
jgi:hypothetical protein